MQRSLFLLLVGCCLIPLMAIGLLRHTAKQELTRHIQQFALLQVSRAEVGKNLAAGFVDITHLQQLGVEGVFTELAPAMLARRDKADKAATATLAIALPMQQAAPAAVHRYRLVMPDQAVPPLAAIIFPDAPADTKVDLTAAALHQGLEMAFASYDQGLGALQGSLPPAGGDGTSDLQIAARTTDQPGAAEMLPTNILAVADLAQRVAHGATFFWVGLPGPIEQDSWIALYDVPRWLHIAVADWDRSIGLPILLAWMLVVAAVLWGYYQLDLRHQRWYAMLYQLARNLGADRKLPPAEATAPLRAREKQAQNMPQLFGQIANDRSLALVSAGFFPTPIKDEPIQYPRTTSVDLLGDAGNLWASYGGGCGAIDALDAANDPAETLLARALEASQTMAKRMKASRDRLKSVLAHTVDGIILADEKGVIEEFNKGAEAIFGYQRSQVIGKPVSMLMMPNDARHHHEYVARYHETGMAHVLGKGREVVGRAKNGSPIFLYLSLSEVDLGGRRGFCAIIQDVGARKATEARIHRLAYSEPESGLPNRQALRLVIKESQRLATAGLPMAVMIVDLIQFSRTCYALGVNNPAQLLRQVGQDITLIPGVDYVALLDQSRLGIVISSHQIAQGASPAADTASAPMPAARSVLDCCSMIFAQLNRPIEMPPHRMAVIPAAGLRWIDDQDPDLILVDAEIALSRARAEGGRQWLIYDPSMRETLRDRQSFLQDLIAVTARGGFELFMQPQVRIDEYLGLQGRLIGPTSVSAEALVRWRHPERGFIAPNRFLEQAELAGLIQKIDHWVIRHGMELFGRLHQRFGDRFTRLSLNASTTSIVDSGFAAFIVAEMQKSGVPAHCLEIEITETTVIRNFAHAKLFIDELRAAGVQIAIDDFGVGQSSLGYLAEFNVDRIKIDRSLVTAADRDPKKRVLLGHIVQICQELKLDVIAEGVETTHELHAIHDLSVPMVQGYLVARPMDENNFIRWMENYLHHCS